MAKLSEIFAEIAERAGIESTSDEMKSVLAITLDVSDTIANAIKKNIVSIDTAKTLPAVRNAIIKDYGAGIMQAQEEVFKELGLTDDNIKELMKEGTISKRIEAGIKKIAEIKEGSAKTSTDNEKALKDQVNTLNTQLAEFKKSHVPKAELDKYVETYESERIDTLQAASYLSKAWSDAYADDDVKKAAFNAKMNKFLAEKQVKIAREGDKLKFLTKEGAEYFDESNKIVTFASVVDQIMTDNKFLAVSNPTPGATTTVSGKPEPAVKGATNGTNKALALLRKAQADQEQYNS